MNCKPGYLAVIVQAFDDDEKFIGRLVECVELFYVFGEPAWQINPDFCGGRGVYDCALRPIHDPGDDAVDEFLALTGKPDYKYEQCSWS